VCSYIAEAKGICVVACAASGAISKLLFVSNGTLSRQGLRSNWEFDESQRAKDLQDL
jgi:hypothetical protein